MTPARLKPTNAMANRTSESPTPTEARKKVAATARSVIGMSWRARRAAWSPRAPYQGARTITTAMAANTASDSAPSSQPSSVNQAAK